jgi:hypothetical protein
MASVIPKINIVPSDDDDKRHRPAPRIFTCTICSESFYRLSAFFHPENQHECPCDVCLESLIGHECEAAAHQIGQGRQNDIETSHLDLGVFQLTDLAHHYSVVNLCTEFSEEVKALEEAFAQTAESLRTIISQLILRQKCVTY